MPLFESYDRRIKQINEALAKYGIGSIEEAEQLCLSKGINVREIVNGIQPIAFENAGWAYVVGAAIAIKKGCTKAADAAEAIGEGLQSFCIPGSVADDRKVGLGHGNLAAMLLRDETECFCFLAGHESFAAAEGAIGIAKSANRVRKQDLRVCLNGLGKDAAYIISRINGFTYVQTKFDYATGKLNIVQEKAFSKGPKAAVRVYGCDDVREGVAVMWNEGVDVSITGNSTNPTRFQHLQEGMQREGQEVLLRGFRRRYGPHPAPGQHGCRSRLLRHDRYHGPHALGRPVRRLLLRARPRGNDGPYRHGQQPDGRRFRSGGRGC